MFNNIGGKIKGLAQVICWIGIVAFAILGIRLISEDDDLVVLGFVIMVIGGVMSWVSSFVLYGFGQLIENTEPLRYYAKSTISAPMSSIPKPGTGYSLTKEVNVGTIGDGWICGGCSAKNTKGSLYCMNCGRHR